MYTRIPGQGTTVYFMDYDECICRAGRGERCSRRDTRAWGEARRGKERVLSHIQAGNSNTNIQLEARASEM